MRQEYLTEKEADGAFQAAAEKIHDLQWVREVPEGIIDGLLDLLRRSYDSDVFEWFQFAHLEALLEWVRRDTGKKRPLPPPCSRCKVWAIGKLHGELLCEKHFVEVRDAEG